jgi:hypothetical protein
MYVWCWIIAHDLMAVMVCGAGLVSAGIVLWACLEVVIALGAVSDLLPAAIWVTIGVVALSLLPRWLLLLIEICIRSAPWTYVEREGHDWLWRGSHKRSREGITINEASVQHQSFITYTGGRKRREVTAFPATTDAQLVFT